MQKIQRTIPNALFAVILSAMLLIVSCTAAPPEGPPGTNAPAWGQDTGSDEFKSFENREALLAYLNEAQPSDGNHYDTGAVRMMADSAMEESVAMDSMAVGAPAPQAVKMAVGGADEYSTTNVQVGGVDEADFIKNDGKYIYTISGDQLVIIDAYPAESSKIVSKTHIEGYPQQMFLKGDKVVVFSQRNGQSMVWPQYGVMPQPRYTSRTHVSIYDIADRGEPELADDYYINGNYFQSRMIGDIVYLIINDNAYYTTTWVDTPAIRNMEGVKVVEPSIYYFDNPESSYRFTTVASFDLGSDDVDAETYLMGYANTMYMSEENLYIAYQKNWPWRYYEQNDRDRFFDVVVPMLPKEIQDEIKNIDAMKLNEAAKWDRMAATLEEMYNKMDEKDKQGLMDHINEAVQEYEIKRAAERSKTVIHRIAVDGGSLSYEARGEVPGTLLNQFSLDENKDNLRVATTTNIWAAGKRVQHNNVYVLDMDLETVGEIEGIAKDERIYSTRFMGDRLYMVTFRQVDPFFVIDLANPRNPEILGELKIPGWSSYLHPYDEDHIIGVGKDTGENEWGGVSTKGVKLALFDVSDVENPTEVDTVVIGDSGSDSEALRDHKAFLFDKATGLLVIPVTEVQEAGGWDNGYYQQRVNQGAHVFTVTDEGFKKRGVITHYEGTDRWWYGSAVRRSLFMDDVLYTVSNMLVKMNDLDTLNELNEIELPNDDHPNYYGGMPEPMIDTVAVK